MATPVVTGQTWKSLNGAGTCGTFTIYNYNGNGTLKEKKTYKSLDSSGALMSQINFTYNEFLKPIKEELWLTGSSNKTTEFAYDVDGKLKVVYEKNQNGIEKYRDSLYYDSEGILKEQRRFNGQEIGWMHRFAFAPNKKIFSDMTFEKIGSKFVATKSILYEYDALQRTTLETHSRMVENVWFTYHSKISTFTNGLPTKSQEIQGDLENGNLLNTQIETFDANGNKIKEEVFDGKGKLLSIAEYTWQNLGQTAILAVNISTNRVPIVRLNGSYFKTTGSELRLLDLRGRLLYGSEALIKEQSIRLSTPSVLMVPTSNGSTISKKGR